MSPTRVLIIWDPCRVGLPDIFTVVVTWVTVTRADCTSRLKKPTCSFLNLPCIGYPPLLQVGLYAQRQVVLEVPRAFKYGHIKGGHGVPYRGHIVAST